MPSWYTKAVGGDSVILSEARALDQCLAKGGSGQKEEGDVVIHDAKLRRELRRSRNISRSGVRRRGRFRGKHSPDDARGGYPYDNGNDADANVASNRDDRRR